MTYTETVTPPCELLSPTRHLWRFLEGRASWFSDATYRYWPYIHSGDILHRRVLGMNHSCCRNARQPREGGGMRSYLYYVTTGPAVAVAEVGHELAEW